MKRPPIPLLLWMLALLAVPVVAVVPMRVAWTQIYNGPLDSNDRPAAVVADAGGNAVVTGSSERAPANWDFYTAKYAAVDGALLWERQYNGPIDSDDRASSVAVDASGNVAVTGSSTGLTHNWDYYTAKYAAGNGALLWERRYNGPSDGGDAAVDVATDSLGNVAVTGSSENAAGNWDYYTAKYAAANGAVLWQRRYNGPVDSNDSAAAVTADAGGNVIVTGSSFGATHNWDFYTAKYAAANGAVLWQQRYNGPVDSNDSAVAVALDGAGNVVVTGSSERASGNWDYYTAKYAAAGGALLWAQRYNGPVDSNDVAAGVAIDRQGDVAVTGRSFGPTHNWDFYTTKYAGSDGHPLWSRRYNGALDRDDYPTAIAVDRRGNVTVTGRTTSADGGWNYLTAKYASGDGQLLWSRLVNASIDSNDTGPALATDPAGSVIVTGADHTNPDADFITLKMVDGLEKWRLENFPGSAALENPAVSGDLADPDRDGVFNLLEYLLGGNPQSFAPDVRPRTTSSAGRLTLQFQRDERLYDLDYTVQVSDTLGNWTDLASGSNGGVLTPVIPGVTIIETGASPIKSVQVRDAVDIASTPRRFIRLKVTH